VEQQGLALVQSKAPAPRGTHKTEIELNDIKHAAPPSTDCPSSCPSLPAQQRNAAALAVSLVAFVGCKGNLEGAARAILAAAATGDNEAFSAGMAVGAASLTGA
jgi:hypothetical protein